MALRLAPATARRSLSGSFSPSSWIRHESLHTTAPRPRRAPPPAAAPPTDFAALNVLADTQAPATAIESATRSGGFLLNNGTRVGSESGVLLVAGETFRWKPWVAGGGSSTQDCVNAKGQFEVPKEAFGVLDVLWPKPDLIVIGVGPTIRPLAPATKDHLSSLGLRVEVLDSKNATAQYNLLATERGQDVIAAALMPPR